MRSSGLGCLFVRDRTKEKAKGFSLLELMCAVAIVGIVAMIAGNQHDAFIMKARRAEMYQNVNAMQASVESYLAENDGIDGSTPGTHTYAKVPSKWIMWTVKPDFSGKDTCKLNNALNFTIGDCRHSYYGLYLLVDKTTGEWGITANGEICPGHKMNSSATTDYSQVLDWWRWTPSKGFCHHRGPIEQGCDSANYAKPPLSVCPTVSH